MKVPPPPPKRDAPQNEKGVSAEKDAQQRPRECKLLQLCNFDHYQITNYGLLVTSAPIKDFFAGRCAFQLNEDLFVYIHACSIATKEACFTSTEAIFPKSKGGVTQAST